MADNWQDYLVQGDGAGRMFIPATGMSPTYDPFTIAKACRESVTRRDGVMFSMDKDYLQKLEEVIFDELGIQITGESAERIGSKLFKIADHLYGHGDES